MLNGMCKYMYFVLRYIYENQFYVMLLMLFFVYLFKLLNGCLELLSYLIRLGNKKD